MSDRGDQKEKEVSKEEPTKQPVSKDRSDKRDQSSKAMRRRPYPIDVTTCTAPVKARRWRPYPIDAATCATPVVIDAEESVAGVKRRSPLIDAATMSASGKEEPSSLIKANPEDPDAGVDDDLTGVSEIQEVSAEEELLRAVGLEVVE